MVRLASGQKRQDNCCTPRGPDVRSAKRMRIVSRPRTAGLVVAVVVVSYLGFTPGETIQSTSDTLTMEFLSPSGLNNLVSAAPDGMDSTFHVVVWINRTPSDLSVRFSYLPDGASVERDLGTGQREFTTATFTLDWDLAGVADGPGTLFAKLYEHGEFVVQAQTTVMVKNAGPDPAETLEMLYPVNNHYLGVFVPPDGGLANTIVTMSHSPGAVEVEVHYAVSPPGTSPEWVHCGTESAADAADGVRCHLDPSVPPDRIEAVAAIPIGPDGPGSGDAHRSDSYQQFPVKVVMTPSFHQMTGGVNGFPCSQMITGKVVDRFNWQIAGMNVDVHADGPVDGISFAAPGGGVSPSQAPDRDHGDTQAGVDCTTTEITPPAAGFQGVHQTESGFPIKHVESRVGTDDSGAFAFHLYNPTTTSGTTRIAAWADADDDDLLCRDEVRGYASVGWNVGGSLAQPIPDDLSVCPTPSPDASLSPDPEPEPEEILYSRNVGLRLRGPTRQLARGRVRTPEGIARCSRRVPVRLQRRAPGDGRWRVHRRLRTNARGVFQVRVPNRRLRVRAVAPRHDLGDTQGDRHICRRSVSPVRLRR
jgi:hypothetical protein